MKTKHIFNKILIVVIAILSFANCDSVDEVIEELQVTREFAPVELESFIRNQTTVELKWTPNNESVKHYVVEFSEDPDFSSIFNTTNVTPDQIPSQTSLIGETLYYIRVKAISNKGLEDSSWATITAETLPEQLFMSKELGDYEYNQITLRWVPNSLATQITLSPGDIQHTLTDEEITNGVATITNLSGDTNYEAKLLYNDKVRGVRELITEVNPDTGTVITLNDDLLQKVSEANAGDILLLEPGDYTSQTGTIELDKSITIRGLRVDFKPKLNVKFEIIDGGVDVNLIDLELDGLSALNDVVRYTTAGSYNSLLVNGCNIHDYSRSFIAGNKTDAIVQSVMVKNSIVSNILTNGGDFIDFRSSDVFNVTVTTSTFNNCAPARDFFRVDDSGTSSGGTGSTCNILLDSCTLYACSNKDSKRILYVRFDANEIEVRNNLITHTKVETFSDRTNQTDEDVIFSNNNYFEAPTLLTDGWVFDPTGSTLDPGFVDIATGDFTLTNQTLIDNLIGDPRWRQ